MLILIEIENVKKRCQVKFLENHLVDLENRPITRNEKKLNIEITVKSRKGLKSVKFCKRKPDVKQKINRNA